MKHQLRLGLRRWSGSPQSPGHGSSLVRRAALFSVIVVALLLRVWGGRFGLPYLYHVDESAYMRTALRLGGGHLSNPPYDPTGFANILFLEYGASYALGRILGVFQSIKDFAIVGSGGKVMTFLILLSRYTSALLGTATVAVVYVLGARIRSKMTGVIAAAFLAVSFLHVRDSHYGVPDITMTFFVVLCVSMYVIALDRQRVRDVMLAGIAGGLAIATKWIALPVILSAPITAFTGRGSSGGTDTGPSRLEYLAVSAAGFALGFAVGSFQVLLSPGLYWGKVVDEFLKTAPDSGVWRVDTVPGWLFYVRTLRYGLGVALLVLSVLGGFAYLVSILRSRDGLSVLVLFFPLLYFLLMGSNRHYAWRYALPLVPFLALFAAEAVVIVSTCAQTRRFKLAGVLTVALVFLAIIQPLSMSIRHDILLTREDTRTIAKEWIEANIPIGAKIALDWPVFSPPLYGSWSLVPYSETVYDITVVGERGVPRYPLDWYPEQGFDYMVISSFVYNMRWTKHDYERTEFYALLDRELELVEVFSPFIGDFEPPFIGDEIYGPAIHLWQRERPGPLIKIYGVTRTARTADSLDKSTQ